MTSRKSLVFDFPAFDDSLRCRDRSVKDNTIDCDSFFGFNAKWRTNKRCFFVAVRSSQSKRWDLFLFLSAMQQRIEEKGLRVIDWVRGWERCEFWVEVRKKSLWRTEIGLKLQKFKRTCHFYWRLSYQLQNSPPFKWENFYKSTKHLLVMSCYWLKPI